MTLQARAADLPGLAFPLTRKLARLVPLSPEEAAALAALQAATRPVSRNREIIGAGRKYDGVFVLIEGTAIRYRVLSDGRRQVLNIALPGDFIGFPASFFETAPYSITALSDALVSRIPLCQPVRIVPEPSAARRSVVLLLLVRGGDVCRAPDRRREAVGA